MWHIASHFHYFALNIKFHRYFFLLFNRGNISLSTKIGGENNPPPDRPLSSSPSYIIISTIDVSILSIPIKKIITTINIYKKKNGSVSTDFRAPKRQIHRLQGPKKKQMNGGVKWLLTSETGMTEITTRSCIRRMETKCNKSKKKNQHKWMNEWMNEHYRWLNRSKWQVKGLQPTNVISSSSALSSSSESIRPTSNQSKSVEMNDGLPGPCLISFSDGLFWYLQAKERREKREERCGYAN